VGGEEDYLLQILQKRERKRSFRTNRKTWSPGILLGKKSELGPRQ